jgi:hypothetical protein
MGMHWELEGNTLGTRWEHVGNTLGTRWEQGKNEKNILPSVPPSLKEKKSKAP